MVRRSIKHIVRSGILASLTGIFNPASLAADFEFLVEPESLLKQMSDPRLVILDTREPKAYKAEHIQGAVNLPVGSTYSPTPPKHRLAPESHIIPLFSNAGIDGDSIVVAYDNGDFIKAARVIWSLWVYGHDNASMLSIDYLGWKHLGFPVSNVTTIPKRKNFQSNLQPQRLATQLYTQLAIKDPELHLVDVRTAEEYRGEKSESRRYGHIPSAVNYDWRNMSYRENHTIRLKGPAKLSKLFENLPRDKPVITYCNKGEEAALGNFILRMLGYDVSLYDGGWYEWGNSADLPIEGPDIAPVVSAKEIE